MHLLSAVATSLLLFILLPTILVLTLSIFDMQKPLVLIFFLFLIFDADTTTAQVQRFKAGFVGGINACQIDGDDLAGWDKLGLRGGVTAITRIHDKLDLSFDILYSQRGAASKTKDTRFLERQYIRLQYVEVPVLVRYKDWLIEGSGEDFHRVNFLGGLSYSRLINSVVTDGFQSPIVAHAAYFNKSDVSWSLGIAYFVNRHFGFTALYNGSINRLYNPLNDPTVPSGFAPVKPLRGKFWTFEAIYLF